MKVRWNRRFLGFTRTDFGLEKKTIRLHQGFLNLPAQMHPKPYLWRGPQCTVVP